MRRLHLAIEAVASDPLVDYVEQPAQLQVGEGALVAKRSRELRLPVRNSDEAAHQANASIGECIQIQGGSFRGPDQLGRGGPARPFDVVDLVVPFVMEPGSTHPPQDVLAAIHSWHANVLAYRQCDGAPRAMHLLGDLDPRCRSAHHQGPAVRQSRGLGVVHRGQGLDEFGQGGRKERHPGKIAAAGGEHHRRALPDPRSVTSW